MRKWQVDPGVQELGVSLVNVLGNATSFSTVDLSYKPLVGAPAEGTESLETCLQRCQDWVDELFRCYAGQSVVVVTHAAPLLLLVVALAQEASGVQCASLAPCNPCGIFQLVRIFFLFLHVWWWSTTGTPCTVLLLENNEYILECMLTRDRGQVGHPGSMEIVQNGYTAHLSQPVCSTRPWHPFPINKK